MHARLGEDGRGERQGVTGVDAGLGDLVDLPVILVGEPVRSRPVVGRIREIQPTVGEELRVEVRAGPVDDPAGAADSVREHRALAVTDVDVGLRVAGGRLQQEPALLVLHAEVHAAQPVEEVVRPRHRHVDDR